MAASESIKRDRDDLQIDDPADLMIFYAGMPKEPGVYAWRGHIDHHIENGTEYHGKWSPVCDLKEAIKRITNGIENKAAP